jgi:DNA repair exonuclease SbcCD ATPase subunit
MSELNVLRRRLHRLEAAVLSIDEAETRINNRLDRLETRANETVNILTQALAILDEIKKQGAAIMSNVDKLLQNVAELADAIGAEGELLKRIASEHAVEDPRIGDAANRLSAMAEKVRSDMAEVSASGGDATTPPPA